MLHLGDVLKRRQEIRRIGDLRHVIGDDQALLDVAPEQAGIDRDQIVVRPFGALHLGEHLVDRAGVGDVDLGVVRRLELLHPLVVGIALEGEDAQLALLGLECGAAGEDQAQGER